MTVLSPLLDSIGGIFFLLGSPSLGYLVLRSVFASSSKWKGWKRLGFSVLIGGGWSLLLGIIFFPPHANERIFPSQLAEFFWVSGMGFILFTGIVSLVNRGIWNRLIHPWQPVALSASPAETKPAPVATPKPVQPVDTNITTLSSENLPESFSSKEGRVYKPSQLKTRQAEKRETRGVQSQPLGEEGDALELLREEQAREGPPSPTNQALKPERRLPMSELSEFSGFEETLAQLKRDLKDFNESVDIRTQKRRNTSA